MAALCHDVGKAISVSNHPAIAAEILRPYVRKEVYEMIQCTRTSRVATTTPTSAVTPTPASGTASRSPRASSLAERFADEWDQVAFDPAYDTLPLEHFEPKVRAVFGVKGPIGAQAG